MKRKRAVVLVLAALMAVTTVFPASANAGTGTSVPDEDGVPIDIIVGDVSL